MERVRELIDLLYGRNCELADACHDMGFSEEDLTDEELDTINEELFRCTDCGLWTEYRSFNVHDGNAVCDGCYDKWFEEEY